MVPLHLSVARSRRCGHQRRRPRRPQGVPARDRSVGAGEGEDGGSKEIRGGGGAGGRWGEDGGAEGGGGAGEEGGVESGDALGRGVERCLGGEKSGGMGW